MIKKSVLLISLLSVAGLVGCGRVDIPPKSSTQQEAIKQEELNKQAVESVGMPAIVNFSEKRMMKDIIELRDKMKPTYTYVMDNTGKYHKICDSLGYGLPYATQFTNPQQITDDSFRGRVQGYYVIPQADPNGLYSPSSADGTWVVCLNPKTKAIEPQYIEPRIFTTTFPLE